MEPAFQSSRIRADQTDELPLFLVVDQKPKVETPAPSARGSATSEAAADAIRPETRRSLHNVIIECLGRVPEGRVLSRDEIHVRTGISVSSLCARLNELAPTFVEVVEAACFSSAKKTLKVNGYRLTSAGRARVVLT